VLEVLKTPVRRSDDEAQSLMAKGAGRVPFAVLDALDQGVAVFDADHRLVFANERYFEALSYPPHLRIGGASLAECLRHETQAVEPPTDLGVVASGDGPSGTPAADEPDAGCVRGGERPLTVRTESLPDGGFVRMVMAVTLAKPGDRPAPHLSAKLDPSIDSGLRMIEALDAMGEGFSYFDPEGRLVLFNARYREYYNIIADEIVPGAVFEDLIRSALRHGAVIPSNQSADEYLAWRLALRTQTSANFEIKLATGQWLRINEYKTSSGGVVSVQSDITALKERENALRSLSQELGDQNILFDAALNNMIQGLCMFDSNQKLIVVNTRYLELYKFSPQVVKPGITLREIMEYSVAIGNYSAEDAERALAERPSQAAKRERNVLLQRLRDGRVIAVMHSPLPTGGSVATYEDVTAREQIELTLRQYANRLENSNRELQDFAFVASHDLQEPLRKIESFGNRLFAKCENELGEDGKLYLDRMMNAASRMRGLITDLLSYSRVTSKAQPFEGVELDTIFTEVVSDLQIAIEEAEGRVDLGPLPIIQADATQMRQLFQNLLSNSLKFRKKGVPPIIRVEAKVCERPSDTGQMQEYCEIVLRDNGIGFENKYADRIFAIFQRLHGKGEYEGTGIGLATVRKIVERHDGTIKAEGIPDVGATFTIALPVKHEDKDQAR
jgi:signal transduction histidine kinase